MILVLHERDIIQDGHPRKTHLLDDQLLLLPNRRHLRTHDHDEPIYGVQQLDPHREHDQS